MTEPKQTPEAQRPTTETYLYPQTKEVLTTALEIGRLVASIDPDRPADAAGQVVHNHVITDESGRELAKVFHYRDTELGECLVRIDPKVAAFGVDEVNVAYFVDKTGEWRIQESGTSVTLDIDDAELDDLGEEDPEDYATWLNETATVESQGRKLFLQLAHDTSGSWKLVVAGEVQTDGTATIDGDNMLSEEMVSFIDLLQSSLEAQLDISDLDGDYDWSPREASQGR